MRLRTMAVHFETCTGQRIGLALRTLGNISLFDVLFLLFKTAGYLRQLPRIKPYEALSL
jgi:hypothetical protein